MSIAVRAGISALLLTGLVIGAADAQTATTVQSRTKVHVETLAADALEGRLAGSAGERQAADYLVKELQRIGARPLPGQTDFRTPFTFTAGSKDAGSTVTVAREGASAQAFTARTDVQALSFSDNGEVSGPVVFAGYGLVVPESQNFGYDSYQGLDVTDKIVLVLRYFPEDADQQTRAALARYSDLRYKAQAARQRGAKALIVITGPRSPNAGDVVPMTFDTALAGSGIVAASASGAVANAVFAAMPDKTLEAVQQEFDSGNPHVAGFAVPNLTLTVKASIERERQTGHNVVAYLPATSPADAVQKPWVVVGAHYDHLGRGTTGGSLAGKDQGGQIHHGADDNASGTAAVLAIAEALSTQPRKRNLLVAFWSGEELGLIGSNAFVTSPPVPTEDMAAYLNFDMVGRSTDNKLTVQATGTSAMWPKMLEQANIMAGFDLVLQEDPYQPTDVGSFNQASVACLAFFTGAHVDYHKPTDTAEKLNYEDLDRIAEFGADIATRLLNLDEAPLFTKVEQKTDTGGGRAGLRIFTGTIPDYATEVKGLLLGGVIGGGPAEQAGLQKGDVIVEIAGQSIANIYDYTYALELLKIGQPAKVIYMRGGERREATLTPAARK
ncbi:MAG: M20/M25/M40 family metallo-hydrolase [Acidobacteriota bacterium]|nr:M20/M25/M40 family metallo-hydrolase [Acidobacteriota bacterium]